MKIYIKKLHPLATIPKQGTLFAGGWDVTLTDIEYEGDLTVAKLGFALQIPAGYRLMIQPRGSFTKTRWIMQNTPGLGDADFFGEYKLKFRPIPISVDFTTTLARPVPFLTYDPFPFKIGERIAQCYLEKVIPIEFEEVEQLNKIGSRDDAGYGTTGS